MPVSPHRPSTKTSLPSRSDMKSPPKMAPPSSSKHASPPPRQTRHSRYYTTSDESRYYHLLVEIRNKRAMLRQSLSILREDEEMIWTEYERTKTKAEGGSITRRSTLPKVLAAYAESLTFVRSEIKKAKLELQELKEEQERIERRLREARHKEAAYNSSNERTSTYIPTKSKRYAPSTTQGTHTKSPSNDSPKQQSPPRPSPPRSSGAGLKRNFTQSSSSSSMSTDSSTKSVKETISTETYTMRYPAPPRQRKRKSPNPYQVYETKWDQLLNQSPPESASIGESGTPPLYKFSTVPWPIAQIVPISSPSEITIKPIVSFLFHPKYKADGSTRRAILRTAVLRWHPDKWEGKFSKWVEESERAKVMEGVGAVMRCLNEIALLEDMRAK